jgi:hypothetical protein
MEVQSISATTIRTSMSIPDAASIGEAIGSAAENLRTAFLSRESGRAIGA